MKNHVIITIVLVVIAFGSWLFLGYINHGEKNETLSSYSTVIVQKRTIEQYVSATGIVKPKIGAEVKVGAQISGIVKNLLVEIGSKVKMGELLAEIELSGYNAKFEMALAQQSTAETERKFAEYEYKRALFLKEKEAITQQQLENAQKLFELASSRLDLAIADLSYAKLQLSYTKILSPIDGIVSSVTTQKGETVSASFTSPTFVTVINLDRLEVWAYVDETDIGRIQIGKEVKFTVDTYPGEEFSGQVESIYPKAEIQNNVVNYITVISINKKEGKILRPEMTTSARITTGKKDNVLSVLKSAVKKENGNTFVYIFKNGEPSKRYIETGISDKNYLEIISGLSINEKVITSEIKNEK